MELKKECELAFLKEKDKMKLERET